MSSKEERYGALPDIEINTPLSEYGTDFLELFRPKVMKDLRARGLEFTEADKYVTRNLGLIDIDAPEYKEAKDLYNEYKDLIKSGTHGIMAIKQYENHSTPIEVLDIRGSYLIYKKISDIDSAGGSIKGSVGARRWKLVDLKPYKVRNTDGLKPCKISDTDKTNRID